MKLIDLIQPASVIPVLKAMDRNGAIDELVDALIQGGDIDQADRKTIIQRILEREKYGSTGFGKGVAVPHVKHEKISTATAAIGISVDGIDFKALDRQPVYILFLVASPKDQPEVHLKAMQNIFTYLQKDNFRSFLRQAHGVDAVMEVLKDADANQLD